MEPNPTHPIVSRTLRAAIKVGDHYWTVETALTLPVGATDADISAALALSARIYEAQQAAFARGAAAHGAARHGHPGGPDGG